MTVSDKAYRTTLALLIWLALLLLVVRGVAAEPMSWSLEQAIDYALVNNPDLAVTQSRTGEAIELEKQVFGNFLPQLNLEGGYTYLDNIPVTRINFKMDSPIPGMDPIVVDREIEMGYHDNYSAQLKLNQLLFASGQVYYAHRAAGQQVQAYQLQEDAARLQVAKKTAEAYLAVLIASDVVDAQRESLKNARAHLKHVQNRADAGAASNFELLRAQVEVSNIEPQLTEAEKNRQQAQTLLRRVTGLPDEAPLTVTDQLIALPKPVDRAEVLKQAGQQRPELLALAAGEQAAQDAALAQRGGMLPAVMLTGAYGYQKPYYTIDDWEQNWTIGIGIRIPLFDGLKSYRGMTYARAQAETLARSADQTRADVRTQVETAALNLHEAEVRIDSTRANLERADKMIAIAEESYTAGAVTSLEVIDAQLAATGARVAHLKALYDYRVARVALAAAAGDLEAIGR